jgi:hypothetical protein
MHLDARARRIAGTDKFAFDVRPIRFLHPAVAAIVAIAHHLRA